MYRTFSRTARIINNPGLALLFAPFVIAMIAGAIVGMIVWWQYKLLWFVLAVLPYRLIRKIRQSIHDRRIARAEDRMAEYIDSKS